MKRLLYLLPTFFLTTGINAQCLNKNGAFDIGEKITYEAFYNWNFIWISAGEVYFKVDSSLLNNKKVYHFNSFGRSHSSYDWIFKVRDKFDASVEPDGFKPISFIRNTYEGGYSVYNKYRYDHENNLLFSSTQNSEKPLNHDTLKLPPCTFDVLSAIYYTRNIDFSNYKPGDKIPISMIIDGKIFHLYIKYLGKEAIDDRYNNRYNCIKFSALLVEGTLFKGGEDLNVWVTDDKNKIPVLVEAKILVGSVKAYLSKAEGLKNKMSSKIN